MNQGSEEYQHWVKEYHRAVFRYLRSLGLGEEQAMDATQDTYVEAWRSMASFQRRSSIRTWLFGIARHVGHQKMRKEKRFFSLRTSFLRFQTDTSSLRPQEIPESQVAQRQTIAQIAKLLETLSPRKKEVFLLFYVERFTIVEIASIMKLPQGTVRSTLHRAKVEFTELWKKINH